MLTLEWISTYLVAILLTLGALSFAFKNTVLFRFVEHTYTGWTVGWIFSTGLDAAYKMSIAPLGTRPILIVSVIFGLLLFTQFHNKTAFLTRWPTAALIGSATALVVSAGTKTNVIGQLQRTFTLTLTSPNSGTNINNFLFIVFMILAIFCFFFSPVRGYTERTPMKQIIKVGRLIVLFGIGVFFGSAMSGDAFKFMGTLTMHIFTGIRQLFA